MKKRDAITQLSKLLDVSSILIHPALLQEIMDIIKRSGNEKQVFTILSRRLQMLREYGSQAQLYHKEFELLSEGIYSMHISTDSINLRILYAFRDPNTMLLLAFYEREGKKKTDYTGKIEVAKDRLNEM